MFGFRHTFFKLKQFVTNLTVRQRIATRLRRLKEALQRVPVGLRLPLLFVVLYGSLIFGFAFFISWSDDSFRVARDPDNGLNAWEAIYFSVVTITTLGYGDITPTNWWGQLLVLLETISGVLSFGFLITSVGISLSNQQARRYEEALKRDKRFKNKLCAYDLASTARRFTEEYDENHAPIHMTGGYNYVFHDIGTISYRKIEQEQWGTRQSLVQGQEQLRQIAARLAFALTEHADQLESTLARHRSELQDVSLADRVNGRITTLRQKADAIRGKEINEEKREEFVDFAHQIFCAEVELSERLLLTLLARCDIEVHGSDVRYDPNLNDRLKKVEVARTRWQRAMNYFDLSSS